MNEIKKVSALKMSAHATEGHRLYRVNAIKTFLGMGEEIIQTRQQFNDRRMCYTSTGVMLICDELLTTIITMFVPTVDQVCVVYDGNIPEEVKPMMKKNAKMFKHFSEKC